MNNFKPSNLIDRYNFSGMDTVVNCSINEIMNSTHNLYAQVIADEDKYLKKKLIEYAQKNRVDLILFDEAEVNKIIDLGIKEYLKRSSK